MKVRITFEAGDGVEAEFIGKTFENNARVKEFGRDCNACSFKSSTACFFGERFCEDFGAFVEVKP